jgi:large subunit ribosomal protein L31e
MAEEERIYTIPLRREFLKAPKTKKSKKAITTIKKFLIRHLKGKEVKIGKELNLKIWEHGKKNPPVKVKIKAIKKDNIIRTNLIDFPIEFPKSKEEKKKKEEKKETPEEKVKELVKKGEPEKKIVEEKEAKAQKEKLYKEEEKIEAEKPKIITESERAVRGKKDVKKKPKKKK